MTLHEFDYEKEPVVSIVKKILTDAVTMNASDIHFDPTPTNLSIKFRINGNLQEYTVSPETVKTNITTRVKILSNMNITDTMRPQTGTFNFEVEGKHTDMRVSSLPVCDGEKIVVHITNYKNSIKSLSKMGISPEETEKIKKLVKESQGLVLITGSASSGKTTTMYSMLREINAKTNNIITIESPVKMKLEDINQVEIAPDKGITYKSALKHVMLQDPNIICIDNLIDDEIARDAIRAAVSGRLVISSLYTKSAYTTIDTLLNMDIENYLLGSNLNGIISQRLVKQLCPKCREKRITTEYERNILKYLLNQDITELYYPKGCRDCNNGYIGQIPIIEAIEITDDIRRAITNKLDRKTIRELLYKNNTPILINGLNKVLEGETSFNEIIRITDVKTDFTEEQKDIREYILGNGSSTTELNFNNNNENENEVQIIEEQQIETPVQNEVQIIEEQPVEEPVQNEVQVVEEQPVEEPVQNEVQVVEEQPVEEPLQNEVQVVEEQTVETPIQEVVQVIEEQPVETPIQEVVQVIEEQPIEEPVQEVVQVIEEQPIEEQTPIVVTEEQENINESNVDYDIIDEITRMINEDENLNEVQVIEQEQTEEPIQEEIQIVEEQPEPEMIQEEIQIVEQPVQDEVPEQAKEIQETPTSQEEPIIEQQEVNVPTPIDANIIEEKPTPPVAEDDDDDEDDFGYGEGYENSF